MKKIRIKCLVFSILLAPLVLCGLVSLGVCVDAGLSRLSAAVDVAWTPYIVIALLTLIVLPIITHEIYSLCAVHHDEQDAEAELLAEQMDRDE
jgi:nitrogen fixation/metabolism regulation signal transduction histidine kinase